MKILLVTHYFWPESFIISDLVKCLIDQGHTIEVLTGKPNYPDGVVFTGYHAWGCSTDYFNKNVRVHRVPIYPRGKCGSLCLFLNYLSFVFSGLFYFHRLVRLMKFDVIFVFGVSPITSVIPAIYLKKRLKIPLALWVQDLWPESLSATGYIKNRCLINLVGRLVRWIYNSTDTILMQSQAFQTPISNYTSVEKTVYYPNTYLEPISKDLDQQLIPNNLLLALENNFCLVFAGNIGKAQSIETLIEAAEMLTHLSNVRIILIGNGIMHPWVEQQINLLGLSNLMLCSRLPASLMPDIFSRAAGLLVTLKRNEIFSYTIPSKIQAYLSAGRPIIGALDGEGGRLISLAKAGFIGPAEDAVALAKNIDKLYCLSDIERDKLSRSGRRYFLKNFEMLSQSQRLIEILEETVIKNEVS